MTRRRSRSEIITDVLSAIRDGVIRPTRIMYAANLSWKPMKHMLESLEKQGLIESVEYKTAGRAKRERVRYKITIKGRDAIKFLQMRREILGVE